MNRFFRAFDGLIGFCGSQVASAYEVGCGEGNLSLRLARRGLKVAGCDVDSKVVDQAIKNANVAGVDVEFEVRSVYDLEPKVLGHKDLIVCCEVLEHLGEPERALEVLAGLDAKFFLVSVPREPIWRTLNMTRGWYLSDFGNTPGHLQHWSKRAFINFLQRQLEVVTVRSPLPWTMALCKT